MGFSTEDYLARFEAFVKNIRSDLQNESLPIYTFQLNRQIKPAVNEDIDRKYDRIREAQRLAGEKIPGVFVFPAIDGLSMSDFIHASRLSYATYAERLAAKVLFESHKEGIIFEPGFVFLYESSVSRVRLETAVCSTKSLISCAEEPTVIYELGIFSLSKKLLLCSTVCPFAQTGILTAVNL